MGLKEWMPFLIFFLGYFFTWRKSQLDKKREAEIYRKLFVDWIKLAKNRTVEQSNYCNEFSVNIMKSEFIDTEVFKSIPLMYQKLNDINLDKAINAFVFNSTGNEEKNLESFNKLLANINYLDKIEAELKEKYTQSVKDVGKINDLFNNSFIELERIYLKKVNEIGDDDHPDKKHVAILGDFRVEWEKSAENQDNGVPANHTFNKLVAVSLNYVKRVFPKYKSSKFLLEYSDELINMRIIERRWNVFKSGHSQIFNQYGKDISKSSTELEGCIRYFETTDVVTFWKVK